ncbi:MAG: hypothetical protein Q9172_002260 [Xanthocarpia lactea]
MRAFIRIQGPKGRPLHPTSALVAAPGSRRTGGVCNPGGIALYLDLSPKEMRENYAEGLRCGNGIDLLNEKLTGIILVSLGAMSHMKDVDACVSFVAKFID